MTRETKLWNLSLHCHHLRIRYYELVRVQRKKEKIEIASPCTYRKTQQPNPEIVRLFQHQFRSASTLSTKLYVAQPFLWEN